MVSRASTGSATTSARVQKVKELEVKKLDLLLKIRELQTELQRTNKALYTQGVAIESALCW